MVVEYILPKIWLQRIQKYWDITIPTDIPESSSEFNFDYTDNEKSAIEEMEENLNTEESIVKPEDIPENEALSEYLGTYNVEGTPGELTLLNPNRIDNAAVNVVAFHFISGENSEDESVGTWEKIEDAQIIDGYVWGTLESFSPISVFTIRDDTYLVDKLPDCNFPGYVANGIPVVISLDDKGNTIATDGYGKVTKLPSGVEIIGGSYTKDLESTSVTVLGNVKIKGVRCGSARPGDAEEALRVKKAYCYIDGVDNRTKFGVTGSYGAVKTDEVEIVVKNSNIYFTGGGESISNGKDANAADGNNCSLASKAWIKKATITIDNSFVDCAYAAGNCGYMYCDDATLILKNGSEATWATCGGSNGATGTGRIIAEDSTIHYCQSTNRGPVKYAEESITDCEIEYLFPTGDSTDSTVTGTIDKVKVDITGGTVNLYPGTNGGVVITAEVAQEIVKIIKLSRSTNIEYKENSDKVFKDLIRIK